MPDIMVEECPTASGDSENNVPQPSTAESEQNKSVQVQRGSGEDLIFMVNDEEDFRKGKSFWKNQGNLFVIMQMKRVVWIRFSVKMQLRSLLEKLLLLYPDITLTNPVFNANNLVADLGKFMPVHC